MKGKRILSTAMAALTLLTAPLPCSSRLCC